MLWVFKKLHVFMFLVFRLDSSKQNWPSRNGFKCSRLPNKRSLLLPQPVHLTRQALLRMKKMMMISENHQLRFCFLYKCFPCTRKQWKKCLCIILYASWWTCHWYPRDVCYWFSSIVCYSCENYLWTIENLRFSIISILKF